MFTISNLTTVKKNGWTYLQCDFDVTDMQNPFIEKKIWVAVEDKNSDMLTDEVYDAFVLVPLMMGMFYKQDVHIEGKISPRFYHNIQHYLIPIFANFSDYTHRVKFTVSGTKKLANYSPELIGTGISCGVDSLVSLYDNYVIENNEDFKVNSLFFFNCGTHGDYENENSRRIWLERSELNRSAANALGLPMYVMDSNFHAFTHKFGEQKIGYLAIYSCILAFQKVLKRYITSSNLSYDEISNNWKLSRDLDIAEYCESYMPHLISTENFELVIDGCQYTRAEKVERISEWEIAQKHLNVCLNPVDHGHNCSCCEKCMWTLIPLEAIGKIDRFSAVFDYDIYRKNAGLYKKMFVYSRNKDAMRNSILEFCERKGMPVPNRLWSFIYISCFRLKRKVKTIFSR